VLLAWAAAELARAARGRGAARALDLGCGAARNALHLARQGWQVIGVDDSAAMLAAAAARARAEPTTPALRLLAAKMDHLPLANGTCDLLIAHGIWNLAQSAAELRAAIAEAARVARPGAGLFVFTFSRATLPDSADPVAGESFVFTQFAGTPQVFLTAEELDAELDAELAAHAFTPDPALPLRELNRDRTRPLSGGPPVIWQGAFRHRA